MANTEDVQPITAEALSQFRITHPDRDLKVLISRLIQLSTALSKPGDTIQTDQDESLDIEHEREMVRGELQKWRALIERNMAGAMALENQKLIYQQKIKETRAKKEELERVLKAERGVLARKQKQREEMIQCDVIARKIVAKGKNRTELDGQIAEIRESLIQHKMTNEVYIGIAKERTEKFKEVTRLADEIRGMKLPEVAQVEVETTDDGMDVDLKEDEQRATMSTGSGSKNGSSSLSTSGTRLNGTALPFLPSQPSSSSSERNKNASNGPTSAPSTRASSPTPPAPSGSSGGSSNNNRHALPSRPSRPAAAPASQSARGISGARLPARPSPLRSVTTPTTVSLEEGEVGGDEEGEVPEKATKRGGRKA